MKKTVKFFHTIGSCGLIGGLAAYAIVLIFAPQANAGDYADMRAAIAAIANYVLVPSMAIAIVTGLLSMAVHRPFQEFRWAWVKVLLGIATFEATLGIVGSKANAAAVLATRIEAGESQARALADAIGYEWHALGALAALSVANVVLAVWRPALKRRRRPQAAE